MATRPSGSLGVSFSVAVAALAGMGVVAGLLMALAGPARAADGKASGIAVLGIEALDGQDNALANEVTEALRQRVIATKAGTAALQGKDLVEIKLVFSCPDEAPSCLAQAGESLGASELVFGNIKRTGGDPVLSLKLLDASKGAIEGSTVETLPKRKPDAAALRALATTWLAKLTGKGGGAAAPAGAGVATLIIRSNIVGATITLDGVEAGVTSKKGLTLSEVTPGRHEITAEKHGYGRITQQFSIAASQALPLTMALQPDGTEVAEGEHEAGAGRAMPPMRDEGPPEDSARSWMRTGFWVTLGLSAVSLAIATKYGLDVHSINNDLDPYRGHQDMVAQNKPWVDDKLAQGNRAETRQWIFIGVGSAFAVASGYLLYKGYLDKEAGANAGVGGRTADNHGLRIFPTANTASGGLAAEFDF